MSLSKEEVLIKLDENLNKTHTPDLVYLYNTEFSKLDNYKLIKHEDDNILINKSETPVSKENLIKHMLDTIKVLHRNHFICSIYNLVTNDEKIKYDYDSDSYIFI